jgi:acetoacetyl-CoA reductase
LPKSSAASIQAIEAAFRRGAQGEIMSGKGKLAYVTGGMGGIGTAITRRLCRDGYTVVAGCGPGSPRKDKWLADMHAEGLTVYASEGNVADWDSTKSAFDAVKAAHGPIDVLVNNAGITKDTVFRKMTSEQWHLVI